MKALLSYLLVGFLFIPLVSAQESDNPNRGMNQFLSKNLKYPTEARANDVQGTVIIQTKFDDLGFPTNSTVISGDQLLAEEVTRTVSALSENWKPEFLGERLKGGSYLMSFQFRISKGETVSNPIQQMIPLEEHEMLMKNPHKRFDSKLEANPYDSKLYEQRAKLYESLGFDVLAQKDQLLADYFKNRMLTEIVIVGYDVRSNEPSSMD
jgi:hypothetical protein